MKYLALIIAIGAMGFAGACDTDTDATAQDEPTATVPEVSDEEKLANKYIELAPKEFAAICKGMPIVGREKTMQMGTAQLGPQIAKEGADISGTLDAMLDQC